MTTTLAALRNDLNEKIMRRKIALEQMEKEEKELADAKLLLENTLAAQARHQQIAQEVQTNAHNQMVKVVSKCLSAVFPNPYELGVDFEKKRGKTEAEFCYTRNGHKVQPGVASGGVGAIASLALRLVRLTMTLPPTRKLLVLDEPFQGLSAKNLDKMGVLIKSLSKELGVQFLIVTHDPALHVGRVIEL